MLTISEKLGVLMRETIGICQKTIISRQDSLLGRVFG